MKIKEKIISIKDRAKQKHVVLLISLIYNFVWAICKIIFGAFFSSHFFCISGASTLLFGFIKKVYLKHFDSEDLDEKLGKSATISILLIISSALFTFYMARFFFINEAKEYGLILSIAIATCSFTELGLALYNFYKAKKADDILRQSFRGCSLASSCFAIVLTQVALLSACQTPANTYNGITGVVLGSFAILIGAYLLAKTIQEKKNITKTR